MKDILIKLLELALNALKADTCELSEEQTMQIVDTLSNANLEKSMSKEQACVYLNISRATFDTYVRNGQIPKGKKEAGFKELSWKKSQLDAAAYEIKKSILPNLYR